MLTARRLHAYPRRMRCCDGRHLVADQHTVDHKEFGRCQDRLPVCPYHGLGLPHEMLKVLLDEGGHLPIPLQEALCLCGLDPVRESRAETERSMQAGYDSCGLL